VTAQQQTPKKRFNALDDISMPFALARYAYSEEGGGRGLDKGTEGPRSLGFQYMNAGVLSCNVGVMDLWGDGGQLVKDFFKYEVQRRS